MSRYLSANILSVLFAIFFLILSQLFRSSHSSDGIWKLLLLNDLVQCSVIVSTFRNVQREARRLYVLSVVCGIMAILQMVTHRDHKDVF